MENKTDLNVEVEFLIKAFSLQKIPNICYIYSAYSSQDISVNLPERYESGEKRVYASAIYYLYNKNDKVMFHSLKGDETWHYYSGNTMIIYIINRGGELEIKKLGNKIKDPD